MPDAAQLRARAERLEQTRLADLVYVAPYEGLLAPVADGELVGVYSHTVLQYVPSLRDLHAEIRRCLRPAGVSSHHIDLTAQGLGPGAELEHLRYPKWLWWLMSSCHRGAETRLLKSDHVAAIEASGLSAEVVKDGSLSALPFPRRCLASPFRAKLDEDLRCVMAHIVAHNPA